VCTTAGIRYGKKGRPAEAGRFCQLRIGIARLVERLFRISITFAGSLALLARFLAAALLLTGFLTRRLIVLAGLVLVRHVVSFHGNIMTTAQGRRRSDQTKAAIASPPLCNFQPDIFGFAPLIDRCATS
jgi:hypothetical protein